ncbi:DUF6906 family protein [Clostridium chrysemydis]|uniref:DUF6906 family protein n=1 Tax=Clostridium chrysemydis TaxID=2665504 RepID=UPI003B75CE88
MKQLKNLSRNQKRFLMDQGLNPNNYLIERSTPYDYTFFDKKNGKLFSIRR